MTRRSSVATAVGSFAAILILAAGCSEPGPTAARLAPVTVSASKSAIGTQAHVLHATYSAGTYRATVTPAGGQLNFGIGSLSFPAGAVTQALTVTATVDGENLAVNFEPHGTVFVAGHEPTLQFGLPVGTTDARIFYVDAAMTILESITTSADNSQHTAVGSIGHFSQYVIATD